MTTLAYNVDEIKIPKWIAAQDAQKRNRLNAGLHSEAKKSVADDLYGLVLHTYSSRVFKNYRAKFIAIKVETPRVSDYNTLNQLEAFCDANKVERIRTRTAVVYRIL